MYPLRAWRGFFYGIAKEDNSQRIMYIDREPRHSAGVLMRTIKGFGGADEIGDGISVYPFTDERRRTEVLFRGMAARSVTLNWKVGGVIFEEIHDSKGAPQLLLRVGTDRWTTVAVFMRTEVWQQGEKDERLPLSPREAVRVAGILDRMTQAVIKARRNNIGSRPLLAG